MKSLLLFSLTVIGLSKALENRLASTPPMGWMAWKRFRCNVDCGEDPKNCIRYQTVINLILSSVNQIEIKKKM